MLGEGKTVFTFVVTDGDGNETAFEIHTDKATVGEALTELGLIAGEEGQYGLYVTEVNGIAAEMCIRDRLSPPVATAGIKRAKNTGHFFVFRHLRFCFPISRVERTKSADFRQTHTGKGRCV